MSSLETALKKIDWNFPDSKTSRDINSIHPYPAKFIPEIPRNLIDVIGLPKNTWVLDPFCGSGVTLVESQLAGIPSIGIDLNPIACLISQVKTEPLGENFLEWAKKITENAKRKKTAVLPDIPNLNHWFKEDVQQVLSKLKSQIDTVSDAQIKNALRLSLSSILVRVSNQESDTRYAAIEKKLSSDKIYDVFYEAAERLDSSKRKYQPPASAVKIICKDIMQVTPAEIKHPIGLVVTSPPYPNAYEYWLYHKYRMYWLGFDPITVKEKEIGARAHFFKKNHHTEKDFEVQMQFVMNLLNSSLVKGGHICIVVGRSKIHGKIVSNADIILQTGNALGLKPIANLSRQIATSRRTFNLSHANIKSENLLVFEKI